MRTPENFTGRIIFMSMFNDTSCGSKERMKKNAWRMPNSFLCMQKDLGKGHWSFIGPGSEKKWYCISEDSPQGVWDKMAERMLCGNSQNVVVQISALRVHCTEVDSKARDMENCRYTMQPIWKRLKLFFA